MIKKRVLEGITVNKIWKAYNGFTLYTTLGSKKIKLIAMNGKIMHEWSLPYLPGLYAELLPNENLIYSGHLEDGSLADFEGAGGIIIEVDWQGNKVWEYKDPYIHHGFHRMKNGNTLIMKWNKIPKEISEKVKGGIPGSEKDGVMWGDIIQEIDKSGNIIWEWKSWKHLDAKKNSIWPTVERYQWAGANSVYEMQDGNILISFRRICTIAIINKKTGKIDWQWGLHEISNQNCAIQIENGNILVLDNGFHGEGIHHPFSRILEFDFNTKKMIWDYRDRDNDNINFFSDFMSSCQRLPNGNTLIVESSWGRIFEVTKSGEIVWEFVNPDYAKFQDYGTSNVVTRAFRYGVDYPGLKGNKELGLGKMIQTEMDIIANKKAQEEQEEQGESKETLGSKEKDEQANVMSRLESLGY